MSEFLKISVGYNFYIFLALLLNELRDYWSGVRKV